MKVSKEEKILALQLILEDIRGNWGFGLEERVKIAKQISIELSKEDSQYESMVESINEFEDDMRGGYVDGRHFRVGFPRGYIGMEAEHTLDRTYKDKSEEFKELVSCITYKEVMFSDVVL